MPIHIIVIALTIGTYILAGSIFHNPILCGSIGIIGGAIATRLSHQEIINENLNRILDLESKIKTLEAEK